MTIQTVTDDDIGRRVRQAIHKQNRNRTACGKRFTASTRIATSEADVTCKQCLKTYGMREELMKRRRQH